MDIDIARIEQQTRLVDRRPRFHARQRHQRHAGAQRQQEQPHTGAVVRRLRPDGALATVGAGGGAAASGEGQRRRMAHRRPAAQERRSTAQERRSTAKASAPPSTGLAPPLFGAPDHRHRELIPRLGTVAMYSRLTSSPSLSDLRSSEILCVTTWLVTTFRVQTFSISSSRLSTSPDGGQKDQKID